MRLPRKSVTPRLERTLSGFLKGVSLRDWIEESIIELLRSANQNNPPVRLSRKIYQARRIISLKYQPGVHPVWGRLDIGDDGFVVILSPTHKSGVWWHQFALAHEIAHTFFYDSRTWPPVNLVHLEPGNPDLEWLCGYFAKCLFVPAIWLRQQTEHYPQFGSEEFSLAVLDQLGKDFSVPWQIVAERLVEHLLLWNCIILQFTMFSGIQQPPSEEDKPAWRLNWQTIPAEGTDGLFIPVGRRMPDGTMKFPRAKGAIAEMIRDCAQNSGGAQTYTRRIPTRLLNSQTTGNLGKFLSELLRSDEVLAYVNLKVSSQEEMLASAQRQHSIIFCLPLKQPRIAKGLQ